MERWSEIPEWTQPPADGRPLQAYALCPDGRRVTLDGALVVVAVDDERGLLIALSERRTGEGLGIRSIPQRGLHLPSSVEGERDADAAASQFSTLAVRAGGANLVFVSTELHGREMS